jgi:8-amino-7-oxononanoate synthase
MYKGPLHLLHMLEERKRKGLFRSLKNYDHLIDFSSNDYLGFSKLGWLNEKLADVKPSQGGSTGSRLISGNSELALQMENRISAFHNAEAALLFNSGYDANVGLLSSIVTKHDLILYDELIHASIHDGIRLSLAKHYKIRHNDVGHLKRMLERNSDISGSVYIVVESVYSMDGDCSPLKEIATLCDNQKIFLIVDEAHAIGVFGNKGRGLCNELGLEQVCFARVYTYGKAMGCHGAAVVGSEVLRSYLINFARSFIYTTALPEHSLQMINVAYDLLMESQHSEKLQDNILYFNELVANKSGFISSNSAIHCFLCPGNTHVSELENKLQSHGFFVKGIKSPTVKEGSERVRICLHTFNTKEEIKKLTQLIV